MSTETRRRTGERVGIDHAKYPGVWIVKSLGPVNAVLEPEGGGRPLRVPQDMLIEPGGELTVPTEFFVPGELLRITDDRGRYGGVWVVIADKGGDRVNLAKLGGDAGRYLRATRRDLVKVALEEVLKV
jgi:hypothetical protein